ncbi:male-specific lethal 1 homolog isoform X1 [Tympanuchus pallidicinctus]|nr:male-specific lethal 1 homolog isoform X1 [Tympanuchus pallidicinctus]XP_052555992.1 male-specific lethal 1 homolog isoform X1 [Tympanuchus pallidicinctus]XP_052555993.1 male-specific lethal 1 homolog isoform X1 [Tympanuchus pallidicinctus]
MRSTTAFRAGGGERTGPAGERGPGERREEEEEEEEEEGEEEEGRPPPRRPKEPPLGAHKGRAGGGGAPGGAPGPPAESWAGPVPLAGGKQAGAGDASGRPRYQAVLPGRGAAPAAAKESAGAGSAESGPPPPPPPPAEAKWRSAARRSGMGAGGGSPGQAACLRQILLLQLDLIEQQQQQLQAKEKEIEELKAERDTLLARIERMERRVQLVKKDTEREKHRIFQGFEVDEKAEAEACEKLPLECPQELLEPSQTLQPKHFPYGRNGKGHKRKPAFGSAERKTPVKKLVSEFSKVKGKTLKHSPVKEESSGSLSETVCKRELRSQETPEKNRSLLETPLRPSAPLKGPSSHPKEKGFFSEIDDLPYLSTTEMYLCRWHQPPPSPLPLREPSPKKEETVAIPSWRDHVVEPLRDPNPSDILENLDDSVFSKRHAKLELDEKRRKRWDIQRIREQRILQRLQLRMYKRKGIQESEPEVTSFFPEPDDVESLLITPYLPVVAFGRPLPKLTPQNFELPWLDERSRCRLEVQKKQTPHRTCRK